MSSSQYFLAATKLLNDTEFHEHEEHSTTEEKDGLIAKAVTMVVLCTVSTIMGIIPMFLAKWFKWNVKGRKPRSLKVVSMLLGFGGGVLFSTTFLHLIPEVAEGVDELVENGKMEEQRFSVAQALCCIGFFIMYLVEESVHTYLRKRQTKQQVNTKKDVNRSTDELVENGPVSSCASNGHAHTGHSHLPEIISDDDDDDFVISSLRGLLIVLGLSVHELFEGLAIGLESSASHVWYMFLAVASHKFVIAFCIGVELVASRTRRYLSIIYVFTFAVVSPLGIGIGMALVGGGSAAASGPLAVILQGLASGTLLYVVFFEVLQEHRTGLKQYISILVGFLMMFGLQMLTAHSHSHSHGHTHNHTEEEENHYALHHNHDHDHDHDHNHDVVSDAIDKVTDRITEAISNALTSSTTPKNVDETSPLHFHQS